MLPTTSYPPGKYGYFSTNGAGLDHSSFQVESDDHREVAVSHETRAKKTGRGGGCAVGGRGGGAYLLAVLFLPAALAPSACKRNPEHRNQPRGKHRFYPLYPTKLPLKHQPSEGVSRPQRPTPFFQAKSLPPVVRGS